MYAIAHAGVVETWKAELITARAKRLGFRGTDADDAFQEVILAVLGFVYDEDKSNGACEATALTTVIDRRLRSHLRRRYRQDRVEQFSPETLVDEGPSYLPTLARDVDVREALARLPEREQSICQSLAQGESIAQIANGLGCSWHALDRAVVHIRAYFEDLGLDAWVAP